MCNYSITIDPQGIYESRYICPHKPLEEAEGVKKYCIFHSEKEDKDIGDFYLKFRELYLGNQHSFIGFVFPKDFSFEDLKKETGDIVFTNADFSHAQFRCPVRLNMSCFTGERGNSFSWSEFSGEDATDFSWSRFIGEGAVNFRGARFVNREGVNFRQVKFLAEGGVDFSQTLFTSKDRLGLGADFSGYEDNGMRKGSIDFRWTTFVGKGRVSFKSAEFLGESGVLFSGVHFAVGGDIDFNETKFRDTGKIDFSDTEFSCDGDITFIDTRFEEGYTAISRKERTIEESAAEPKIIESIDETGVAFRRARFSCQSVVIIKGETFLNGRRTDFRDVFFERPGKVTFDGVNLTKSQFLGTDIRYIQFHEVLWPKRRRKKREVAKHVIKQKNGFMVYDEVLLKGDPEDKNDEGDHKRIYRMYNQLRLNYEDEGNYFDAGDFFIGSMEMRRKGDFEGRTIKCILSLYRLISYYGERPLRSFLWLMGLWSLFTILTTIAGIKPEAQIASNTYNAIWEYVRTWIYASNLSLDNLTLGKLKSTYIYSNTTWGVIIRATEFVFGILIIPLFVLSMNRKFRRPHD